MFMSIIGNIYLTYKHNLFRQTLFLWRTGNTLTQVKFFFYFLRQKPTSNCQGAARTAVP